MLMAEFMFIDVGESDWCRTASKMCTVLVETASWYGAVFMVNKAYNDPWKSDWSKIQG